MSESSAIPAYVPKDRVYDFDVYQLPVEDMEYQAAFRRLYKDGAPDIFWTPRNGGHWVVTRAADIGKILMDAEHFSSENIVVPKESQASVKFKPLQVDPPEHLKYRNLLAPALSPKAVTELGIIARQLAIELIEGFQARGECEFMSEFAHHLPVAIFMKIVDLPESDRHLLSSLANGLTRGETPEISGKAAAELTAYGMQKIRERRANPGKDLISHLATAQVDGKPLDDDELAGMITLLLNAGLDTVASMLGFFMNFLGHHPEHRRQLVDNPELIPNAVEEMLRRFAIAVLGREVKKDIEFGGVPMKAGDMVSLPSALDGMDDRKYANPEDVDFSRKVTTHATFGGGVHRCMGSMLARVELRICLEEWLKRIPDFQVKPDPESKVLTRAVATITKLTLVWNPKQLNA